MFTFQISTYCHPYASDDLTQWPPSATDGDHCASPFRELLEGAAAQ